MQKHWHANPGVHVVSGPFALCCRFPTVLPTDQCAFPSRLSHCSQTATASMAATRSNLYLSDRKPGKSSQFENPAPCPERLIPGDFNVLMRMTPMRNLLSVKVWLLPRYGIVSNKLLLIFIYFPKVIRALSPTNTNQFCNLIKRSSDA